MGKAAQSDHSVAESPHKGAKARVGNEQSSSKEASTKKQDSMFQKMFQSSLVSCSTWDIYSPPPSNSFSGKVVPRVLNRHKNRRKLSLEVHKVTPSSPDANDGGKKSKTASRVFSYEECVLRYDPICPCQVHVHDTVVQILTLSASTFNLFSRILVPSRKKNAPKKEKQTSAGELVDDEDENTVAPEGLLDDVGGKAFDGWEAKYRIPCQLCSIKQQQKKSVFVLVEVEHLKQEREIIFDSIEEAQQFVRLLEQERRLEETRGEARLQAALGDVKLPSSEKITLLIEIVSGWDLPIGDFVSSDPYVVCTLGRKEVHRTKPILST